MVWLIGIVALYLVVTTVVDIYDTDQIGTGGDHLHESHIDYLHKDTVSERLEVIDDDDPSVSQGKFMSGQKTDTSNASSSNSVVNESTTTTGAINGVTGWYFPLDGLTTLRSPYGARDYFHAGLDMDWITVPAEEHIFAVNSGKVVKTAYHSGWGYYAEVEHPINGETYYSLYAHMKSSAKVSANDDIEAGDLIGIMGSTGNSSGQHLHLEIGIKDDAQKSKFKALASQQDISKAQNANNNGSKGAWWYTSANAWSRLDPRNFFTELKGKPTGSNVTRSYTPPSPTPNINGPTELTDSAPGGQVS